MLILFILPVVSTFAGGLLALYLRRSLTLLIALGTGLLLGAALLDLLPEAIQLGAPAGRSTLTILGVTALSFLFFAVLEAGLNRLTASRETMRQIGLWLLLLHSLRDGMAIGLAFAASHPAGVAVAAGIAAHDLGDGVNTIVLATGGARSAPSAWLFLLADSLAPLAGGLLTLVWTVSAHNSVLLLAVAAGFFLHMAATDFLPQLYRLRAPFRLTLPAVLSGATVVYLANILLARLK